MASTWLPRRRANRVVYPVASQTVYRDDDGTDEQNTSFSYTWFSDSTQPQSQTITYPEVSTSQNGPGTVDTETVFFDTFGNANWRKDLAGFLHYTSYDVATDAAVKTITDVDSTQTSSFTNLPGGWSTPSGAGCTR